MWFQFFFKISIFPAARRPGPARPPDRRVEIFFPQNLCNNILGKVKKFGTPRYQSLGVAAVNVEPWVKMTPPGAIGLS